MIDRKKKSSWIEDGYSGPEFGEWYSAPSDSHSVMQWHRKGKCRPPFGLGYKRQLKDPNRGYTTKPETRTPKVAIMQALHICFNLGFGEIVDLCYPGDYVPRRRRIANVMAVILYAGGSANTLPWWKRKYQKEAIEAAKKLIDSKSLTVAS